MTARPMRVLLSVEDAKIQQQLATAVQAAGCVVLTCGSDAELLTKIEEVRPKLVCLHFDARVSTDVAIVQLLLNLYPRLSILLVRRASDSTPPPPAWMNQLVGYVSEADDTAQLHKAIAWALCNDAPTPQKTSSDTPFLIGRSQMMLQVDQAISRMADSEQPVLIQGEHGTGKRLSAITLHCRSSRRDLSIHTLNCADYEDTLLDRLLFGKQNQVSTSSLPPMLHDSRIGTIVLAEIAAISPALQAKLIKWIRQRTVGDGSPKIIFTTARDLGRLVADRKVRADLFLELSGQVIGLPPLRHRPSDIRLLIDHFSEHINNYLTSTQRWSLRLDGHHYQILEQYAWPNNVRELRSVLLALALTASSAASKNSLTANAAVQHPLTQHLVKLIQVQIGPDPNAESSMTTEVGSAQAASPQSEASIRGIPTLVDPMMEFASSSGNSQEPVSVTNSALPEIDCEQVWGVIVDRFAADDSPNIYSRALALFEKELLKQVLGRTGGNISDSARLLGISDSNLQKKIRHLEIKIPDSIDKQLT